jgi:hypothetical protein
MYLLVVSINFISFFVLIKGSPVEADLRKLEEMTLETGSVIDVKQNVRPQKSAVFSAPMGNQFSDLPENPQINESQKPSF